MCLAARSEAGKYGSKVKSVEIYYYFSVEEEKKNRRHADYERKLHRWMKYHEDNDCTKEAMPNQSKIIQFSMMCLAARSEAWGGGSFYDRDNQIC